MKERKSYPFCKMYKGLMMAFTPPESVFMIYMADLEALRGKFYNTLRSKKKHMGYTNIGYRQFDQCVEKTISMGLLDRVPKNGMYDYFWDMDSFRRLLEIVNSTNSYMALQEFCERVFVKEKRTVASVTPEEITRLRDTMF